MNEKLNMDRLFELVAKTNKTKCERRQPMTSTFVMMFNHHNLEVYPFTHVFKIYTPFYACCMNKNYKYKNVLSTEK